MGITKDIGMSKAASTLRHQAEEQLFVKSVELKLPLTREETRRLAGELEVHQIELEMQNAELRQARDEVESALAKYTNLYDFAPIGYFTLDRDGAINAVNLSGASLLGVERARMLSRRFAVFVPINDRPFFSGFLGKVFARQGKESCELTLTTEGNGPLFVQIEAVADASGQECRVAVIDISERRYAEGALIEKRRELEELNRSLEARIVQAVDDARQKDQMLILQDRRAVMGEMIGNIAHQWRQPLNTLGLVVQLVPLCYDSGEFSREFIKENTGKAMALIQYMSQTIDDFRNFFRSDKEAVPFSVSQVIAGTLCLVKESFKEQKIEISLQNDGDSKVYGFPNEYSQVLLNILMNARDALIGHKVDDALISIRCFSQGGRSVVTITDNAGGIAEKIMGKLFDPYFTTKGPAKGTGIGLFMSRTIIEKNMAGKLTFHNTGCGAEFRIEV